MKNSNLKNTIIFIDKKAELEGKGKVPKLNLRKLGNDAKIIGYQEHKKIKIHEAKKQKFLNSKFYKFRKKIVLGFIVILSTNFIIIKCIYLLFYCKRVCSKYFKHKISHKC